MNRITRILFIVSLFAILAIIPISFCGEYIYISTIIELFYIIAICITVRLSFDKNEKKLGIIILLYSFTALTNLFFIRNRSIIYTLNKIIPIVFMYIIIGYSNRYKIEVKKTIKWIQFIMNFIVIVSFVMYIIGYSGIRIENGAIQFIPNSFFQTSYGESRLAWIFTHKSRFAILCFLNIGFLLNNRYIKSKTKKVCILISLFDIYLSSSKTILGIAIIVMGIAYLNNNFITKKEKLLKYSVSIFLIIFIVNIIPKIIKVLSNTRDVASLGGRLYIWEAGIRKAINNFWGIGQFDNSNWLTTEKLPGGVYTHAHNMFINEIIERGILPGLFFILIFLYLIFMYKNRINKNILIGCILSSFMDNTLTSELSYVFWFIMLINYLYEKEILNKVYNVKGEKNEEESLSNRT
ncbi:O-antigen ligase family protein [Clostridium perfringens]